jgi:hypothetical protein
MLDRLKIKRERRRITRQDRQYLEAGVRYFLNEYLSANDIEKDRYFEVVAGIATACQPKNVLSYSANLQVAGMTAEAASTVARSRIRAERHRDIETNPFLTDACATVAVAFRRAAGIYVDDEQMQTLGTAAVHLVIMATFRRMVKSKSEHESPEASSPKSSTEQSCENG